ncbi:YaiI/YqxD family protein [Pararhizobium mangrovi]|uniref:UPF0178 protein FJU11_07930 n=1 Tax=Pararhizobium mangrovi TaxID=2590452 RepID=A0A506UC29_9HYPH|nr:YaiI/YqxD family protein [Pararhizobium mangrovi]TPW29327.1 YaiI/YqxD family protein [Pararhizobium mangrovi]
MSSSTEPGSGEDVEREPTVFVDADACPVKTEIIEIAGRFERPVRLVTNSGLRPSRDPLVRIVMVSKAFDAADDWIAERAGTGDVVVTTDVPLAVRCVEAGADVLGPTGRVFTPESIGMASAMRDLKQDLREAGAIKGYNAPFSPRDRSQFREALDRILRRQMNERAADPSRQP